MRNGKALAILFCYTIINDILCLFAYTNIQTQIFKISDNFFYEPYLFPKEKSVFYDFLDKSHIYFEYGSGGSTLQAAKRGLKIYSAEVGSKWVSYLQNEIESINILLVEKVNITYLYSELQSEIFPTRENFKKYVTLYDHQQYKADLIYIDGQYHSSCALNIYNQIDNSTIVIIHDLDKPELRKTIKSYYKQILKVGRLMVLQKKATSPQISKEIIENVEEKDFTSRSKKTNVINYLRSNYDNVISKYFDINMEKTMKKPKIKQVWFFWWQGMENALPIVKLCLSAIQQNLPDGIVTVITKENMQKLIKLPPSIIVKMKNGTLSFANFADILRHTLISTFGGLWIDATILAIKKLPSEIFEYPYYSIHFDDSFKYVTGKWAAFLHHSFINGIVSKFCSELMIEYMKDHDGFHEYFLTDFMMLLGYEFIPSFKRLIQKVPFNNPNVLTFMDHFNDKYTNDSFEYLTKDTIFFKNSWKITLIPEINNYQTIFGKMAERYFDANLYNRLRINYSHI